MKKILISFTPGGDTDSYDEIVDLSDIDEYIKRNPRKWEFFFRNYSSKLIHGKPILELFQINEYLNIWFYNKFRIFYDNRNAFYELDYLAEHLNDVDEFYIKSKILNQFLFLKENIKVIKDESDSKEKKINYLTLLKYSIVFFFRILISKKRNNSSKNHFLFFQIKSERLITSIKDTSKKVKLNSVWGYLVERFRSDFGFIEDFPFPGIYDNFQFKRRMFITRNSGTYTNEYIIARALPNRRINKLIKNNVDELRANLKLIRKHSLRPEELLILNHFTRLIPITKLYIRKYYSYDLFFRKQENISSVLAYGENLSQSKITLDAASKNSIKTIGLQHGIMRSYNVAYNMSEVEAKVKPMPDLTLVWGKYWKNQLIKNANYTDDSIEIVGQPRTDIVPLMKEKYPRNINQITFFAQLQPDLEERYYSAKCFIEVAKKHQELDFVIKMHPSELDDIYTKLILESKVTNVVIEDKKDTFQLLAESGIIMTCYSTVGGEAMCFDTPVINFDSQGRDIAGYINSGVTYWVKNEMELNEIISKYRTKSLPAKPLEEYVENTFSTIDGNVCQRIRDLILT